MPALPTTNLTLHCRADITTHLFKTYVSSGVHTGTPTDGEAVQVWDDEADGIADVSLEYVSGGSTEPDYRSSTPLMLLSCLDFNGTTDYLQAWNQAGSAAKPVSSFVTASAFTVLVAFYAESITATSGNPYNNHTIWADAGGFLGLHLRDVSGVKKLTAYHYDGTEDSVELTIATATSYVTMMRHESGSLYLSLNGGTESSVVTGNTNALTGQLQVGKGQGASSFLNGRIGEFAIWNAALTGSTLSDAITYFTDKWVSPPVNVTLRPRRMLSGVGA